MAILPPASSVNRLMVLGMPGGCRAPILKMRDSEAIATKRPRLLAAPPMELRPGGRRLDMTAVNWRPQIIASLTGWWSLR